MLIASCNPILGLRPLWILGWSRNDQSLLDVIGYLRGVRENITEQNVDNDPVLILACHLREGGDTKGGVHRAVVLDPEQSDGQSALIEGHDSGSVGAGSEEPISQAAAERAAKRFED